MAEISVSSLLKTKPVKNRVKDGPTCIIFDRENIVWEAGEVKHLPEDFAAWFVGKSAYLIDTTSNTRRNKLVIVGTGQDESDITLADLPSDADGIVDWSKKEYVHPVTGQPFKRVSLNVNGIPVSPAERAVDPEEGEKAERHRAVVEAGVEKIAEMTREMTEAEIMAELKAMATPSTS